MTCLRGRSRINPIANRAANRTAGWSNVSALPPANLKFCCSICSEACWPIGQIADSGKAKESVAKASDHVSTLLDEGPYIFSTHSSVFFAADMPHVTLAQPPGMDRNFKSGNPDARGLNR